MRLYVHVMPVCSVGAPVISGVALVLWLCAQDGQIMTETCSSYNNF